jgi:hypothetical protein
LRAAILPKAGPLQISFWFRLNRARKLEKFLWQIAEKLNFTGPCEERKRRGNLRVFVIVVTEIASQRSQ